jgi:hypothetical protein
MLNELPDDVLIHILSYFTLTPLLSLRVAHSRFYYLVSNYIKHIGPIVAANTFPDSTPLLLYPEAGQYSPRWLNQLYFKYLATFLVDKFRFGSRYLGRDKYFGNGIRASDVRGEELRHRVAGGWRVLKSLSNISQACHSIPNDEFRKGVQLLAEEVNWKLLLSKTQHTVALTALDTIRTRERLTLMRRKAFLRSLPRQAVMDYQLLMELLPAAFFSCCDCPAEWPKLFPLGFGCQHESKTRKAGALGHFQEGNSWMHWFILHEGPDVFWQQWCPAEYPPSTPLQDMHSSVRTRLLRNFQDRDQEQIDIERNENLKLHKFIESLSLREYRIKPSGLALSPTTFIYPYWWQYLRQHILDEGMHVSQNGEDTDFAPFFIDLRITIEGSDQKSPVRGKAESP